MFYKKSITIYLLLMVALGIYTTSQGQNTLTLAELRVDATFNNISINQTISGDDNLNSTMIISYRELGTSTFLAGATTMRAHPELIIDGSSTNLNFHAGSIMHLDPGTTYEIRIELIDPDGGGSSNISTTIATKLNPTHATDNIYYVAPGTGGGSGTQNDPYLGLQTAADNALPGDHFIVTAGTYTPFQLLNSGIHSKPISFLSESLHDAIIDGGNTNRGIVTLGEFDTTVSHIIIDGFSIQHGRWGIDAQRTQYVTVRNNVITDVNFGYVNRREGGIEHDQTISNNIITGRTVWPQSGIPGDRGIDIRGNNNVVRHNTISFFGDGISTDGAPYMVSYSLDIHHNDITNIVDDIIEVDGCISNTRIYRNQGYNGRAGVSLAPVFGGPCYVIRNELFNLELSAFKMNRGPSGLIIAHNTISNIDNAMSSPAGWQNTIFRNNVIFGARYCFEEFGLVQGGTDDWNYGAYYSTRGGSTNTEWFKWDNIRYASVSDLQNSGLLESNAIEVAFDQFENIALPADNTISYSPADRDFMPLDATPVINSGDQLNNINLPYVNDSLPDRGALEFGMPRPTYGAVFENGLCNDGIKNGDEDYIDCGGSLCIPCHKCPYETITVIERPLQNILTLRTSEWIKTSALLSNEANIDFSASSMIELLPSFEVSNGGLLIANIKNCD